MKPKFYVDNEEEGKEITTAAPVTEKEKDEKAQTKKVNPQSFFQNMIKKGGSRQSTKKPSDTEDKGKFSKLRLDDVES